MADHGSHLVELERVNVQFNRQPVLHNISLRLQTDCITTLIGPNGAGKTTLVRLVLGLIKPSSGTVWRKPQLRIGYMPQKLHIDRTLPLSVERFLNLPKRSIRRGCSGHWRMSAPPICSNIPFTIFPVARLSGTAGTALLRDPELLVLDEPVQGVDLNGQLELYKLIAAIRQQRRCGVLMVSHDLHLVMASTDQVVCLNHHICCSGHPEQVSNDPSFLELFGPAQASVLALYHHHHGHRHDVHGNIIVDHPQPGCSW